MRVVCGKCGDMFESLIIDQYLAWKELQDKTAKHAFVKHHDEAVIVAQAVQRAAIAIAMMLHVQEFVIVPTQEVFIMEQIAAARDVCMLAAGFEPEEADEADVSAIEEDKQQVSNIASMPSREEKEGETNVPEQAS